MIGVNDIELTVALPLYNSKEIAWLALESLCRQKDIDFKWELLVAEEVNSNPFGQDKIFEYTERLREVGCMRIQYIPVEEWIPLSYKWRMLGKMSRLTSKIFVLQAADCYSSPRRLAETYWIAATTNADWINSPIGVFYDVNLDKSILYDQNLIGYATGLNMAFKTSLAKRLPHGNVAKGVDNWLFRSCEALKNEDLKVEWNHSEDWRYGLDTNGLNNISVTRCNNFIKPKPPFTKIQINISDYLPADIVERLKWVGEDNRINKEKRKNIFNR